MRMLPRYYAPAEGTTVLPYPQRPVTDTELHRKRCTRAEGQPTIWIEDLQVHALYFPDGRAWDVINGWRNGTHWLSAAEEGMRQPAAGSDA